MNINFPLFRSTIPTASQTNNQIINHEDNNIIENSLTKQFSEDLNKNHQYLLREFEHVSKDLVLMGYQPRLVIHSFLAFKYQNIEEALELIDKNLFSMWNHKFISSDNNICYVCNDKEESHKNINNILRKKKSDIINYDNPLHLDFMKIIRKNSNLNNPNEKGFINFIENPMLSDYSNLSKIYDDINSNIIQENKDNLCPICFSNIEEEKNFNLECNHKFCKDCIEEYLKEEIKNSRVFKITCPQKECNILFIEQNIKENINDEFLYKYNKFLLREKYKKNQNYVICPIINCEGYAEKDKDFNIDKVEQEYFYKNEIIENKSIQNYIDKQEEVRNNLESEINTILNIKNEEKIEKIE